MSTKARLLSLAFLVLHASFIVSEARAQDSIAMTFRNMGFVKRGDPWLTSLNAAALTRLNAGNVAEAELSLTKQKGGHTDFDQSPDALVVEADVESFIRLNASTVVYGSMSYNNFAGDEMGGSAFTPLTSLRSPLTTHRPFDLVEDSLNTAGHKHRDVYQLTGGVGSSLCRQLAIGARLDYTAANYAKYKDLRHKNKLMDMQFTAGVYLPLTSWFSMGLDYRYHRTTESLQFSTYGSTDRNYQTLVAYGAFMGYVEQFGSNGYTDRSHEMPLVSDANGVGVQVSIQSSAVQFYNAFTYSYLKGYYGRRSPYTVTYTDHHSRAYHYDARLSWQSAPAGREAESRQWSRLALDFSLNAENLENLAATYRELASDAGAAYYEYYSPVKTANKLWVDGAVALTADLGIRGEQPLWTLTAGFAWQHRHHTAYLYPSYRRQRFTSREWNVSLCRQLMTRKGIWSLQADAAFREGSGQPAEDLTFQDSRTPELQDSRTPELLNNAYLWREYQWLAAPQYMVGGSVKYTFVLSCLQTYIKGSLHHRKANQTYPYSNGKDRTEAVLAIGCTF